MSRLGSLFWWLLCALNSKRWINFEWIFQHLHSTYLWVRKLLIQTFYNVQCVFVSNSILGGHVSCNDFIVPCFSYLFSFFVHWPVGVARPVLVVPWIVIQELDSLKVCLLSLNALFLYFFLHIAALLIVRQHGTCTYMWSTKIFKQWYNFNKVSRCLFWFEVHICLNKFQFKPSQP